MNKVVAAVGVLGVGLVALLGLYLLIKLIKGVHNVRMAAASPKWPTTREITESTSDDTSVTFNARTVIQYSVDGEDGSGQPEGFRVQARLHDRREGSLGV